MDEKPACKKVLALQTESFANAVLENTVVACAMKT